MSLNSAQGVGLLDGSTTYWYIVKRSSAITTAVDLRYCYVEVPGFYVPKWGTEPAGNAAHLNNLKAVTFEIIIRISNFDEANTDISSLMGIEQYFCFRAAMQASHVNSCRYRLRQESSPKPTKPNY